MGVFDKDRCSDDQAQRRAQAADRHPLDAGRRVWGHAED